MSQFLYSLISDMHDVSEFTNYYACAWATAAARPASIIRSRWSWRETASPHASPSARKPLHVAVLIKMSNEQEAAVSSASSSGPTTRSSLAQSMSPAVAQSPTTHPHKRKRSSFDVKSLQGASFPQGQAPSNAYRIGFVGAGNMARAIAEGMVASGMKSPLINYCNLYGFRQFIIKCL